MTAPVTTDWWPTTTDEATAYADDSVTCTLTLNGNVYERTVMLSIESVWYGADADGRRGEPATVTSIDRVIDNAPGLDHPHRDAFDALMPCAETLVNRWREGR